MAPKHGHVAAVPVNKTAPTISGTAQVGQALTASTGTWTNSPTKFAYQWGTPLMAFSSTLPLTGGTFQGSQTRTVIPPANLVNIPSGSNVTAHVKFSLGAGTAGGSLLGAYIGELRPGGGVGFDGHQVRLTFSGANTVTGLGPGVIISDRVPVAIDPTKYLVVSAVWGGTQVNSNVDRASINNTTWIGPTGSDLDASASVPSTFPSSWIQQLNTTHFIAQIDFAPNPISGATASTYTPVIGDIGRLIMVSVIASNAAGSSLPKSSALTSNIVDAIPTINTVSSIPGTPTQGTPITAIDAVWNNSVTSKTYQWQSSGVNATGAGATTLTYTPVAADVGCTLTITVTASNSGGTSIPSTSAQSAAVVTGTGTGVPVNTAAPTISGTPQVGQTLTASTGTWTNSPTSFTYQWNRAGTAIGGATAATYVPVTADVGNTLTVTVTATNGTGSSTPATSAATSAVIASGSACSTTPTGSNPTFNPLDPAASGYELVFDSEFNNLNDVDKSCPNPPSSVGCTNPAGSNWYLNTWTFPNTATNPNTDIDIEAPPYPSNKTTVLRIHQSQINGNWAMSTMGPSSGASHGPAGWQKNWNGRVFTGGWYTEARFSTEWQSCTGPGGTGPSCVATGTVVPASNPNKGHASIWSYAMDKFSPGAAVFSENDLMDGVYGDSVNPAAFYLTGLLAWNGSTGTNSHNGTNCIQSSDLVSLPCGGFASNFQDRTHPHIWGQLWVPATATTQGYVQQYFDGVAMGTFTWNQYVSGQTTNPGVIDIDHMQVNIGNDPRNPEDVNPETSASWWDWVHVWQLPAAATASGNSVVTPQANFSGATAACKTY
jgi:hypothetical protein